MNYEEAISYIEKVSCSGIMPGLVRIQALLEKTGHPEMDCNVIHVAGTNGKGSVCTYIASILMQAGYKVGRYVSPTLFDYRERIQVNGKWISRKDTAYWMSRVREVDERMQSEGIEGASAFELETVMAFLYFKAMACDFVVLETGMGGRLDATNVVPKPVLSVVTSIGMDHMHFLGNTIEAIAVEKGGIIKEKRPVVIGAGRQKAVDTLIRISVERQSEYAVVGAEDVHMTYADLFGGQQFDFESYKELQTRMVGRCQPWNAAIAVKAVEIGDGFQVSRMKGSEDNDGFHTENGQITKTSNHAGGIMGGISDGSEIVLRAAVKPTPSISQPQNTVTKDGSELSLEIHGRHDPVIVPRAVVVVESMCALAITDALFSNMTSRMDSIQKFYQK